MYKEKFVLSPVCGTIDGFLGPEGVDGLFGFSGFEGSNRLLGPGGFAVDRKSVV